jgi:PAS domain S-box-containing protein
MQLTSLLRNYPHTLFIKDDVGRFANVTTHTAGNYGFTRSEMIGLTDYELFSTTHADDLWEEEQRIIADGQPMINDIEEYVDQSGHRRWVSTTKVPRRDSDGEIVGVVGGTQDVTPAKQQEALMATLHEASRELSRATTRREIARVTVDIATDIESLPAVQVALSNTDGSLEPVVSSQDNPDASIFERYEPTFPRTHERGQTHYVAPDGTVTDDETEVVDAVFEGSFGIEDVAIVIPLGEHGVLGLVAPDGSVDDFTNRLAHVLASNVTAAFDRAERERKLARKNRQLEEFATLGAHELRNRLQIALANVVHERSTRDSDRLVGTEQTLERMDRLLTQLLQLARTSRIPRTTDPTEIRRAAGRAWKKIQSDGATLTLPPERTIAANTDALTELFDFLFTNCVEHGGSGVAIEVGLLENGFYVEDNGVGIPDAEKSDLFEVRYADTAEESGYGLYIVSAIVEAHGWEIEALDSASGGARFEVTGVEWR